MARSTLNELQFVWLSLAVSSDFESEGRGFESLRARQLSLCFFAISMMASSRFAETVCIAVHLLSTKAAFSHAREALFQDAAADQ